MTTKSLVLPGLALLGLCLAGLVMAEAPGAVAGDAEAASLFGGQACFYYSSAACGASCAQSVHLPGCEDSCCSALTGFRNYGSIIGKPTSSISCGGGCGTIHTGIDWGCAPS